MADEVFITNPFVKPMRDLPNFHAAMSEFKLSYLQETSRVLRGGGRAIITSAKSNIFASVISPYDRQLKTDFLNQYLR